MSPTAEPMQTDRVVAEIHADVRALADKLLADGERAAKVEG